MRDIHVDSFSWEQNSPDRRGSRITFRIEVSCCDWDVAKWLIKALRRRMESRT